MSGRRKPKQLENADDDPCRASTIARIYPEASVSPAEHAIAR
jgi:hypothetical protein